MTLVPTATSPGITSNTCCSAPSAVGALYRTAPLPLVVSNPGDRLLNRMPVSRSVSTDRPPSVSVLVLPVICVAFRPPTMAARRRASPSGSDRRKRVSARSVSRFLMASRCRITASCDRSRGPTRRFAIVSGLSFGQPMPASSVPPRDFAINASLTSVRAPNPRAVMKPRAIPELSVCRPDKIPATWAITRLTSALEPRQTVVTNRIHVKSRRQSLASSWSARRCCLPWSLVRC